MDNLSSTIPQNVIQLVFLFAAMAAFFYLDGVLRNSRYLRFLAGCWGVIGAYYLFSNIYYTLDYLLWLKQPGSISANPARKELELIWLLVDSSFSVGSSLLLFAAAYLLGDTLIL